MEISRDWFDEFTIKHLGREIRSIDRDDLKELYKLIANELGLEVCIDNEE
jgi:hypothetical protein